MIGRFRCKYKETCTNKENGCFAGTQDMQDKLNKIMYYKTVITLWVTGIAFTLGVIGCFVTDDCAAVIKSFFGVIKLVLEN